MFEDKEEKAYTHMQSIIDFLLLFLFFLSNFLLPFGCLFMQNFFMD